MSIQKTVFRIGLSLASFTLVHLANAQSQSAWAYSVDKTNHVITISPTGEYNQDARNALAFLTNRSDTNVVWTMKFNPGKYYLSLPLYCVGLKNVHFISNPASPAKLIKGPDFNQAEYIFYTRMSSDVNLQGFEFYGKTSFQNNSNPVWSDQGVFFGSCRNIVVDNNKFFNFGNAALRVTTSEVDSTDGVNSFNTKVTNNYFNNVYQVSTTSNDKKHGGTHGYLMEKNTFVNLRGSVKFASRTPGAGDVHIIDNVLNGGDHFGLEIDNYNDMEIRGNHFENIKSVAINMYTAGDEGKITKGFPWGSNFIITDNVIKNSGRGIRFCPAPFYDGTKVTPQKLVIDNNTLNAIGEPSRDVAAIAVINGNVDGVQVTRNQMYAISSKKYISLTPGCTGINQSGNKIDGAALSTDGSDLATNDTKPPSTPSNLAGKYNSANLTVRLDWTNNAPNESQEEVWGSLDGKKYSLIAKLNPQSTRFAHKLKTAPSRASAYYAIKSINKNGASPLSTPCKVNFQS
jgi:hypothetical protein